MPKAKRPVPPKPGLKLYENFFAELDHSRTLSRISDGITAVITNANRLLEDVEILAKSNKLASAGFLLATADEEMAKIYILLDMCRLDFSRHENYLKNLCRGFYNHVVKYAYRAIIEPIRSYPDMENIREFWLAETTRYWPSGFESGEPDFPHDTVFHRELPLYVDFIDYDQAWHIPDNTFISYRFEKMMGEDSISKSKNFLKRIKATASQQFFKMENLSIVNEEFKKQIISEKTTTKEVQRIYKTIKSRMPTDIQSDFEESSLCEWPLYYFVEAC